MKRVLSFLLLPVRMVGISISTFAARSNLLASDVDRYIHRRRKAISKLPLLLCLLVFLPTTAYATGETLYEDERITITATRLDYDGTPHTDFVYDFQDGYAQAYSTKYGHAILIDQEGTPVIPTDILVNTGYGEGLVYSVDARGQSGYINLEGEMVIPYQTRLWFPFYEGVAVVSKTKLFGAIDHSGNLVIPLQYEYLRSASEGLIAAKLNDRYGFLDTSGNPVIDFQFKSARDFHEGLAAVCNSEGKYGYIDQSGTLVIDYQFADAGDFSEGLAWVIEEEGLNQLLYGGGNGTSYYIDSAGNKVFTTYGYGSKFENGVAETGAGYIDKSGHVLIPSNQVVGSGITFETGVEYTSNVLQASGFSGGLAVENAAYPGGRAWFVLELTVKDAGENQHPDTPSSWAQDVVSAAIAAGIVPENLQQNYTEAVSRGEVAEMFIRLLEKSSGKDINAILAEKGVQINPTAFTDTTDKNVLAANALGIISGVGNNRFDPNGTFTRAQIAAILNRTAEVLGVETDGYTHTFTDVSGHWVSDSLGWPVHAGIINGVGDNRFDPDGVLTTEQSIVMAQRALEALSISQ